MKTTITIENGRIEIQVDDQAPVLVQPTILKTPVISTAHYTSPPTAQGSEEPSGLAPTAPAKNSPPRSCVICGDDISDRHFKAKVCTKPECRKALQKDSSDKWRRGQGQNVGAGRGKSKQSDTGQFTLSEQETAPPLHEDAPPAKTSTRSKCCDAKVEVAGGEDEPDEGGTRHYVCMACMNACDTYEHTPEFMDPWICGACRLAGRLCSLHYKLEADGRVAPEYRHES